MDPYYASNYSSGYGASRESLSVRILKEHEGRLVPEAPSSVFLGGRLDHVLRIGGEDDTTELNTVVEIVTETRRHLLYNVQRAELKRTEAVQLKLVHDVKELGPHVLHVSITYKTGGAPETKTLKKQFKFTVYNPLSVRTKAQERPDALLDDTRVYLAVQVQNQSDRTMSFDHVGVLPVDGLSVADLNADLFRDGLRPKEARQYLFVLSGHGPAGGEKDERPMGKLDIRWTFSHGENGQLQTSTLSRRATPRPSLVVHDHVTYELLLERVPADVVVDVPFVLDFRLRFSPLPKGALHLAVQHVKYPDSEVDATRPGPSPPPPASGIISQTPSGILPTPERVSVTSLKQYDALRRTPRRQSFMARIGSSQYFTRDSHAAVPDNIVVDGIDPAKAFSKAGEQPEKHSLPPPVPLREELHPPHGGVAFLGPSVRYLDVSPGVEDTSFSLEYVASRTGLVKTGGLRLILLDEDGQGSQVLMDLVAVADLLIH